MTPTGLVSQIRVRQSGGGDPGWLDVPVLVDGTGVHGLHPETNERTGDFRLVDGEWRARLRGGSGMPGDDFRQDDEFWEGMWVGDRASLPVPMDVDATVDPALLPVVDPVPPPVLDSDKHWQPPQRAAFVGTLSTTGKLAVMGRLVKLRPVSRSTTVGYWTDDTRVWVQLPDGGRVMVVYPHPVFGLRGTRTRIVEGWRRVPGVEATAARRGIPDSKSRLSVDGRRITLNGLGGTEVEYRYDATTVWLLLPDGRKIMATHSHPVFDPAAAGPVTEAGWSREPGETATWHSGKMSGSRLWVNHRRVVLGSDVHADADLRYTYDATTVWLILPSGQQIMVTYPYPAFYPAGASPVVEEGWPREPSGKAAMARLGTAGDNGLDVDGREVPLWPTHDGSPIKSQVAYRFDETTVWVRWRDGRKAMVTYPHPVFGPSAAGRVVVDGWRDPNYLMVSDNWPEPGGGPMELDGSLQATVVPVPGSTGVVVGGGEPSRLRSDGWMPPQEAASSAMLHSGTMTVKGRSVRLPTKYGDTEVTYWADDTRLWVLLPDGRKAMVVFPNPVFGSGYDRSTVIGSWERQPSGLASAARPGTLDRQKRLAVDGRVVLLAGHLEAKTKVEYRYDATTVWVRSQDGREVMVTYRYPIFDPAAAGPLMVEGWPQQPNAMAEFRSSNLVQGQVRVNNRVVQLGRKYPDSPLDYAYDARTVWVRLANRRKVMVTYPYPVFDPADRKPEVEEGWSREPSAQAAMARLGTVSAFGQISVDRLLLYFGKKIGGTSTQGPVAYRFDETTVWVRWRDGRKAMVTFPYPAAAPAAAGPVVVDGWRDPNYLMVSADWDGGPVDQGEDPVSLDVIRQDEEFRADMWHDSEKESLSGPMDLDGTADDDAVSVVDPADTSLADAPATPAASVSDAEASDGEPSQLTEDPWQPPQSAPSTGKIRNRNLPVMGRDVRLRSSHAGATVPGGTMDPAPMSVVNLADLSMVDAPAAPAVGVGGAESDVGGPSQLSEERWQPPKETASAGRLSSGTLMVMGREVSTRSRYANVWVEYWTDDTTVWVLLPDGDRVMVVYPQSVFGPPGARSTFVHGWLRGPSTQATAARRGMTNSAGRLVIDGRKVSVGRYRRTEVEYRYDATTVWFALPSGERAMATYPYSALIPAAAGPSVEDGWPRQPDATTEWGTGKLSRGELWVNDRRVKFGADKYPDAQVLYAFDATTVWLTLPGGKQAMATFPYPVFYPPGAEPVVVQGWPREPGPGAATARRVTVTHGGHLSVDGRTIALGETIDGTSTEGLVGLRFDATTVWVRWRDGRRAMVTFPHPVLDPAAAGPVLVDGWRDPNYLMDSDLSPEEDDGPATSLPVLMDLDEPLNAAVRPAVNWVSWPPPEETASTGDLRNGKLIIQGRVVQLGPRHGSGTVEYWTDDKTVWVRLPDGNEAIVVYPTPTFGTSGATPTLVQGWPQQPDDLAAATRSGKPDSGGQLRLDGRHVSLGAHFAAGGEVEYRYDATTVWARSPGGGTEIMVSFPFPVFDPAAAGPVVADGWSRQPDPSARFVRAALKQRTLKANNRFVRIGERYPDATVDYTVDATTVWVRWPDGRKATVTYPYPVFDPAERRPVVVEGWPQEPGEQATPARLGTISAAGQMSVDKLMVYFGQRIGGRSPRAVVAYRFDATTVWVRWRDGRKAMVTYPYPALVPAAVGPVVVDGWRDPNYLMVSDDWPEHDGGRANPREEPVSLGPPMSAQSVAATHESAAVAEVSVGRGRRGVADDRGVVVVGEMARWREWSQASAVVVAAQSSARPVVVVDAGEGLGPRSAVLSALGMVLLQFGRRRQQPLVVATGLVSEVTTVVGRYGLPVIGPDGAGPDARWQVVGPDGVVHWSARAFSMASFAVAGEVSPNAVQRADSEVLTQWLAQPDWPAAESFLRENTGDLLHPQIRQELVQLSEQDPANRLLPVFKTILDLVGENGRAVDPADSRYRAPGPSVVEPFDGVRGPLSVTFALDYLEPKPDPSHRKPWDDRLLRLMYLDPRARDRAGLLAAGVLGEQRGRVDDGRWNATVFGAVTTALGMTVEQAVEQAAKPWPVGAWGKALEDVACCEANPEHRMYWIPRMDELRDLVSVIGIPGWIDGPAPAHGQLLEVLTETLASC
ncbi:hypothetical protein ABZ738_22110 [Micromonospora sp. NPDC047793]|uniref:hypothetical protein n=1 Tax=Micromonospora sp. NPDC047793 TaxID=3154342 RepID=UPI0033DD4E75